MTVLSNLKDNRLLLHISVSTDKLWSGYQFKLGIEQIIYYKFVQTNNWSDMSMNVQNGRVKSLFYDYIRSIILYKYHKYKFFVFHYRCIIQIRRGKAFLFIIFLVNKYLWSNHQINAKSLISITSFLQIIWNNIVSVARSEHCNFYLCIRKIRSR